MSAEIISAALPRTPESAQRPIDSDAGKIAQAPEASALLRRMEATTGGEGPRQEEPKQQTGEQVANERLRSLAESKVTYPSPIPSLPAPLIPIREVPAIEASVIDSNPALDGIENTLDDATSRGRLGEPEGQGAASPAPISIVTAPVASRDVAAAVNTPKPHDQPSEPVDSGRPNSGTERVMQSVVLAQAQDKPPVATGDTESAGRIVSFSS